MRPFDHIARVRSLLVVALVGAAGWVRGEGIGSLLDRNGPDASAIIVYFVVPMTLAILLTALWRLTSWRALLLALVGCLLFTEAFRFVLFGINDDWRFLDKLRTDSKDQFFLLTSIALQIGSGLFAFAVAKMVIRRIAVQPGDATDRASPDR